ncbi:MAG: patatin-like phospholipase family protein, partial [Anaerolineaceae bacterium]
HAFFRSVLQELEFADLRIPLTLVAVDLDTGREVHLRDGNVADAVRSTVSLPGIFAPFERNGSRLVDGGLLNNLPSDVVREMGADRVLAVDVGHEEMNPFWHSLEKKPFMIGTLGGLVAVLGDSLEIMMRQQRDLKLQQCPPDYFLHLPIPPDISVMSGYHRADELIRLGEEAAQPLIGRIRDGLGLS